MKLPLEYIRSVAIYYFTPTSLSNMWSFGVGAFVFLFAQIVTGFILITYYIPYTLEAAKSIEHLMRDVCGGWLVRYAHISGASFFFFMIYSHIGRGIYFGSYVYPRANAWLTGSIIFYLAMLTAFSGYILPWGQMSYWAATVITNLLTVLPYGENIVTWVWGGSTITTITLSRFFTIHFITPFVIVGLVLLHIVFLHTYGSGNANSRSAETYDLSYFSPYYIVKDIVAMGIVLTLFMISVEYYSLALAHPDNYIPANPFVTPNHIVPEWYFLSVYAILRSCPTKIEGIVAFASTILILLNVYYLSLNNIYGNKVGHTGKTRRYVAIGLISSYLILMANGAANIEEPFISLGETSTYIYFYGIGLLVLLPVRADRVINNLVLLLIKFNKSSGKKIVESRMSPIVIVFKRTYSMRAGAARNTILKERNSDEVKVNVILPVKNFASTSLKNIRLKKRLNLRGRIKEALIKEVQEWKEVMDFLRLLVPLVFFNLKLLLKHIFFGEQKKEHITALGRMEKITRVCVGILFFCCALSYLMISQDLSYSFASELSRCSIGSFPANEVIPDIDYWRQKMFKDIENYCRVTKKCERPSLEQREATFNKDPFNQGKKFDPVASEQFFDARGFNPLRRLREVTPIPVPRVEPNSNPSVPQVVDSTGVETTNATTTLNNTNRLVIPLNTILTDNAEKENFITHFFSGTIKIEELQYFNNATFSETITKDIIAAPGHQQFVNNLSTSIQKCKFFFRYTPIHTFFDIFSSMSYEERAKIISALSNNDSPFEFLYPSPDNEVDRARDIKIVITYLSNMQSLKTLDVNCTADLARSLQMGFRVLAPNVQPVLFNYFCEMHFTAYHYFDEYPWLRPAQQDLPNCTSEEYNAKCYANFVYHTYKTSDNIADDNLRYRDIPDAAIQSRMIRSSILANYILSSRYQNVEDPNMLGKLKILFDYVQRKGLSHADGDKLFKVFDATKIAFTEAQMDYIVAS